MFKKLFKSEGRKPEALRRGKSRPQQSSTQKTTKKHRKIAVSDLRLGMFVVELDKPWEESGFMFQGLHLRSLADIHAVQKECSYVWVDYEALVASKTRPAKNQSVSFNSDSPKRPKVSLETEYTKAREVHELASETITTLFKEIRLGAEVDGAKVQKVVRGCVESILRNPDATIWLTRLKAKHEPTAQHSLNVSALSIVVAKAAGMSERQMIDVGVCGMLHDVGKTNIPTEIISKRGPLSAPEMIEMRKHTRYGRDILMSTKSVMSGAADVAHSHHEREDGTGYPRNLKGDQIPLYAKIVAITEAYDNMTTAQVYREAKSPSEALQELYSLRGKQFSEEYVDTFIEAVGIFPPGSIVEMLNGDIGIVLSSNTDKLRPRVIIILDPTKEPLPQRVVDLSQMETDFEGKPYQIRTTHSDGSFGINVSDFQRAGLRIG